MAGPKPRSRSLLAGLLTRRRRRAQPPPPQLPAGFVLAASNGVAGVLSDATKTAGFGSVGCFGGGAAACVLASALLLLFSRFGDLGKEELVAARRRPARA